MRTIEQILNKLNKSYIFITDINWYCPIPKTERYKGSFVVHN